MVKTTRPEKYLVRDYIYIYARAHPKMSVQRYQRILSWAGGMTYGKIAELEGVKRQGIGYGVKRDVKDLLQWVAEQQKLVNNKDKR